MSKAKANWHLGQSRERLVSVERTKDILSGDTTINDVIKHVKENDGDLDSVYFDITTSWNGPTMFFAFTSPETDEEWAFRLKQLDELEAREKAREMKEAADKKLAKQKKEENERAEYERLKAKFGQPTPRFHTYSG